MNKHPVTFISIWDGGYEVDAPATLDLDTGLVIVEEGVEVGEDEVETLDLEVIEIDGSRYEVVGDDHGDHRLADMSRLEEIRAGIAKIDPSVR